MLTDRTLSALTARIVLAATLVVVAACGPGGTPSAPEAESGPGGEPPIDWLIGGPGAEVLGGVPGSTWTPEDGVSLSAECGPVDELEGWRVSATLVDAGEADGFSAGGGFEPARAGAPRSWEYVGDQPLRLVERDDGRVDFELFVPVDEAPAWEDVDEIPVEVVFGGQRCG